MITRLGRVSMIIRRIQSPVSEKIERDEPTEYSLEVVDNCVGGGRSTNGGRWAAADRGTKANRRPNPSGAYHRGSEWRGELVLPVTRDRGRLPIEVRIGRAWRVTIVTGSRCLSVMPAFSAQEVSGLASRATRAPRKNGPVAPRRGLHSLEQSYNGRRARSLECIRIVNSLTIV